MTVAWPHSVAPCLVRREARARWPPRQSASLRTWQSPTRRFVYGAYDTGDDRWAMRPYPFDYRTQRFGIPCNRRRNITKSRVLWISRRPDGAAAGGIQRSGWSDACQLPQISPRLARSDCSLAPRSPTSQPSVRRCGGSCFPPSTICAEVLAPGSRPSIFAGASAPMQAAISRPCRSVLPKSPAASGSRRGRIS